MNRKLPAEYRGWDELRPALRRLPTAELVTAVQDGAPATRLAALSVINLREVPQGTVEDWVRTLPDPEANELAGAIPAQRGDANCHEDVRWVDAAMFGYERRRLPTFLVMLFSTLEALEKRGCVEAQTAWERVGDWLGTTYGRVAQSGDSEALGDLSLFVFENYLDRHPVFEAFCGLLARHEALAMAVSIDPRSLLGGLPEAQQRYALQEAASGGGMSFAAAWSTLHQGRP
jgi:hypothetical protein